MEVCTRFGEDVNVGARVGALERADTPGSIRIGVCSGRGRIWTSYTWEVVSGRTNSKKKWTGHTLRNCGLFKILNASWILTRVRICLRKSWDIISPDGTGPEPTSSLLRKRSEGAYPGASPTPSACMIDGLRRNEGQRASRDLGEDICLLSSILASLGTSRVLYGSGMPITFSSCSEVAIPELTLA